MVHPERGHQTRVGWVKQAIFWLLHQYIENDVSYVQSYY